MVLNQVTDIMEEPEKHTVNTLAGMKFLIVLVVVIVLTIVTITRPVPGPQVEAMEEILVRPDNRWVGPAAAPEQQDPLGQQVQKAPLVPRDQQEEQEPKVLQEPQVRQVQQEQPVLQAQQVHKVLVLVVVETLHI